MNLQTKKIEFIQEFLELTNEQVVVKLQELLNQENAKKTNVEKVQLPDFDLNARINQAEDDKKNNRFVTEIELKNIIQSWD
jgi:hypothetical protein